MFARDYKKKGVEHLSTYLRCYKNGDIVDIKGNGAFQKGMPHKSYHGKTGRVFNVSKHAVGVVVNKRVKGRILAKRISVRIEHVNHSKCRADFLRRVKANEALKTAAKQEGKPVPNTKREAKQPIPVQIIRHDGGLFWTEFLTKRIRIDYDQNDTSSDVEVQFKNEVRNPEDLDESSAHFNGNSSNLESKKVKKKKKTKDWFKKVTPHVTSAELPLDLFNDEEEEEDEDVEEEENMMMEMEASSVTYVKEETEIKKEPLDEDFPDQKEIGISESIRILDRYLAHPNINSGKSDYNSSTFKMKLVGRDEYSKTIMSPFTGRMLKPYIRRDLESRPLKLRLLNEIVSRGKKIIDSHPIDYCYVQPHHIPAINSLVEKFFWPGIDLSECLQYPDFSCVVLYRRIVIAFAFLVPDVSPTEAYISFIFTHPEWRRAGIGKFMLYHLIQTCMGKDIILHVSANNPAILLYQKFGFKVEEHVISLDCFQTVHNNSRNLEYNLRNKCQYGSLAGCSNVLIGLPFDTLKNEGILKGFYSGYGPSLTANVGENAVLFYTYGWCRECVLPNFFGVSSNASPIWNAIAGSMASTFSSLVLCPTEMVKCRLQVQRQLYANTKNSISAYEIIRSTWKNEGIAGFYKGLTATWARELPGYFALFLGYEGAKSFFLSRKSQNDQELGFLSTIFCGGLGGFTYWLFVFPMDVIKSRIQVRGDPNSVLRVGINIIKTEGVRSIYRGVSAALIRSFPSTGALFLTYETSNSALKKIISAQEYEE
ncbi:Mitochondrial ornithine transporter 1,60S ribosomal protein L21-2,60S ribosomal protein L21-A,60S ribosomal protein L21,60S ribosomal protein L21-B,Cysteine-rich protein 2-binding protein,60S ribosomal protein L21-1 [Lepeophtheirus salmonis]|uniref:60S ribosomal protein L21 n=1 Tax=Lepeophtheirus salmonis TaxID=72036 RepID=A0A7R8CVW5_LEPSM|nr:Mitochondrial ornithine transporter 1,60S ribosomal protein L21-2,60S ribosomal protein L21-A,60S ribosomal protein L21,60S ribosomal protein L21-B,Cysteine-rich protein 2-binding protein,60S ribosomal protein L21-1 [Lepeophtheirus salmonis]CAF2948265.1 Mitochondrial ornithine transporter 1,60S ribosomal protein L21-2,60S ribosomal protein L21-A,60S ribosomal protein L21,60S ribosomal protein L21-B,Cysteine-rich protein 2-binding protein,60S ribosomal protein L21-1 [Lepeophtheirus salmonis]